MRSLSGKRGCCERDSKSHNVYRNPHVGAGILGRATDTVRVPYTRTIVIKTEPTYSHPKRPVPDLRETKLP